MEESVSVTLMDQVLGDLFLIDLKSRDHPKDPSNGIYSWNSQAKSPQKRGFPLPQSGQAPPIYPSGRPGKFAQMWVEQKIMFNLIHHTFISYIIIYNIYNRRRCFLCMSCSLKHGFYFP